MYFLIIYIYKKSYNLKIYSILYLKKKSENNTKKYGWHLYECDESQKCIENLIKQMLQHVYNYSAS